MRISDWSSDVCSSDLNSTGQSARWSTMTMPLTASVGAKRRPAGVPQALQACARHDPVGKNRRDPSMRPTVQGGALLRCRRFSIEGRMMRMTRGWLSLLMLVSASAQAADLAVTRVESSVFVRHANGDHAALSNRDPLQAGDTVSTGAQGHVSMRLAGGGSLLLGPNVALQIDSTKPPEPPARATLANLILNSGALHVDARKTDQDAPADIHIKLRYLQARFYGTDAWVERSAAGDEICLITGAAEIDTPGAHQRLDAPGECLRWTAAGAQRLSASEAGTLLPRLAATNFSDDYATRYAANQAVQYGADRPTLAQSLPHNEVAAPATNARNVLTVVERSEEHTSELQSLMRISYAVFCLKKKKINNN